MATFVEALDRARQLLGAGDLAPAETIYAQLLQAAPQAAELWHEMGILQLRAGQHEKARDSLIRATSLNGNEPAHYGNLGAAYCQLGQHAEAVASFRRALELGPPSSKLYNNLALSLKDCGRIDEALNAFDIALQIQPDYANGHFNRGNLLRECGRPADALASYRHALCHGLNDAGIHWKVGSTRYDLNHMDEALEHFERALTMQPDYAEAHLGRALVWLARGDYARGWPEFEWRLQGELFANRPDPKTRWDGSPLAGRTLWVYDEQGLGDTLQFVRYVPVLEGAGGPIGLEVRDPLVPLLESSGFGQWLGPKGTPPRFDVHCSLLSLAGFLPDRSGKPYWRESYLKAAPDRVAAWREKIDAVDGFKIGIIWAGSPGQLHDRNRSVHLRQFAPLAAVEGVRLVSLQRGPAVRQIGEVGSSMQIVDLGETFDADGGAFMDSAAVMQQLDLVISVDSSPAHLAGGLGVRTWVALQVVPDWRWMLAGSRTPWYPSMTLFRQREFGNWQPVFAEMAAELRRIAASG